MRLLPIDPGPTHCGVVLLDCDATILPTIVWADAAMEVGHLCGIVLGLDEETRVVVEGLTSYGSAVGKSVLDTAETIGRIRQCAILSCVDFHKMLRPDVKLELCQSRSAKDAQVKEAIRHCYREAGMATGGGSDPCRGTKKAPGPLYGISSHAWSALALGLAWLRREG